MHLSRTRVTVAGAVCLLAAACTGGAPAAPSGGGGSGAGGGGDKGSLTYLLEEPEDAKALSALEAHIAGFEKESGVKVEMRTLPFYTLRTVLQTQLRSGDGPDVFSYGSGPGFGGALAKAGLVKDLTAAYEERDWKVYDFAKERVTFDGKTYGVPGELETIGLFYNKAVFTELGLQPPKSLDELRAAADKIKASGRTAFAVGDKEGYEGGHLLSMALSSAIGSDGMEELFAGTRSWDSPEVVAALSLWKDFNAAGYLPKSPTSVDYDTSIAQFFSGEAAMIPTGSWLIGEIEDETKFEVGYIPFPAPDGPGVFTSGLGSGPYVSASTDNPDGALEFVDFLASPEHGAWTVENLNTIPPQEIDVTKVKASPLLSQVLKDTAAVTGDSGFGYNIDVMVSDKLKKAMEDGFQGVLTGQRTPQQVAASLEAARS